MNRASFATANAPLTEADLNHTCENSAISSHARLRAIRLKFARFSNGLV
jgi:hypothetical protein